MDLNLEGKTALVTGASKGIGFQTALRLAQEGCHVHLVARTRADLADAATRITEQVGSSVQVDFHSFDLSQNQDVDAMIAACDPFDILVNNAGAIPGGSLEEVDEETWRDGWELKVFGYINSCRRAYERMKQRRSGVIINVIGTGGERPVAAYAVGAGGNAALMSLTRALGGASLEDGIRVVGVNPGPIMTDRLEGALRVQAEKRFGDSSRWSECLDGWPTLGHPPGEPQHIADMVAFLASDLSAYTTGTIITIDGGHMGR
jgi:NAD(P)-dependent dehydrogenase (short-subunit alcohol dehydrogenase family)